MMAVPQATIEILADPAALARRVASWLLEAARAKTGVFSVALSGGLTPRRLFQTLAVPPYAEAFPWARSHWFWGDERFVPHYDARSNYRMAREELLSRVSIPVGNIHPIPTERITPQAGAQIYENELKEFYGSHELDAARPLFDATLLGLGTDGHTASLFPDTPALAERRRWVAPVNSAGTEARITLTYPALDSSRAVAFLVEGKAKQTILARYRAGDCSLPASHIAPIGSLHIFADRAAAGELT